MIDLDSIEIAYARFNAQKTVSTLVASQFETMVFGSLVATSDAARSDSYYNRILGCRSAGDVNQQSRFGAAMRWLAHSHEIRVDMPAGHNAETELAAIGFRRSDELVWLTCPHVAVDRQGPPTSRELVASDLAAIRQLLETSGQQIDDTVWEQKRAFLGTPTFRWFGVFDEEVLVSAASLWNTDGFGILGSAFTLPTHRGLGFHSELLAARQYASQQPLLVDVEPESSSYRNCLRAGCVEAEIREIWLRRP